MAYAPIARTLPQYVDATGAPYSGAVLKAYAEGTSTPISFALDDAGGSLQSSIALNASGYPEVSGNEVIPYLSADYKLALYPTQAAADANSGAIWSIDNIPLFNYEVGGNRLTNVGNGTARTDAINVGQVQDGQFTYLGTTGGAADAYTITASPVITAYAITQRFWFKCHASNLTTTPYLQLNGITDPATTAVIKKLNASKAEIAVEASDLLLNGLYEVQRNSANTAWIILNPQKPTDYAASETAIGVAEIATQAETDAGTDDTRFITPLKLVNAAGHQVGYGASVLNTQSSGAGTIPRDNTKPQSGEGNEFTTLAYTPKVATSLLEIEFFATLSATDLNYCLALFQDAGADSIAVSEMEGDSGAREIELRKTIVVSAASLTARTYKLRYGVASGTCYINRRSDLADAYGGILYSGIIVREIAQ